MRNRRSVRARIVSAASGGFVAGAIAVAVVVWIFPAAMNRSDQRRDVRPLAADRKDGPSASGDDGKGIAETHPGPPGARPRAVAPAVRSPATTPSIEADPVSELRNRRLDLPVRGAVRRDLRDSFDETRGSTRHHEAIDIMAPRDSPVLAVEDGTIARLFESKAGGTTVYQFDPAISYVYYYAHLARYADGLREGGHVQRGQVLGYVGTTGNASKETPHLHFAIFRLREDKRWWQGTAIDPYALLK